MVLFYLLVLFAGSFIGPLFLNDPLTSGPAKGSSPVNTTDRVGRTTNSDVLTPPRDPLLSADREIAGTVAGRFRPLPATSASAPARKRRAALSSLRSTAESSFTPVAVHARLDPELGFRPPAVLRRLLCTGKASRCGAAAAAWALPHHAVVVAHRPW